MNTTRVYTCYMIQYLTDSLIQTVYCKIVYTRYMRYIYMIQTYSILVSDLAFALPILQCMYTLACRRYAQIRTADMISP